MIPIGDGRRRFGFPWVTTLLVVVSVAILLAGRFVPGLADALIYNYGLYPTQAAPGQGLYTLGKVLTSLLVQGPAWMWLEPIATLLYLWVLGRKMEDACGPLGVLIVGLLGGLGGGAAQIALRAWVSFPQKYPEAAYGLAGVVAGLFGAYMVLYQMQPIRAFIPPLMTPNVPVFLHFLWWAGWTFVNVNWDAVTGLRPLEVFWLEPNWPALGALLIGLPSGYLFARREFLWLRLRDKKAAAPVRR